VKQHALVIAGIERDLRRAEVAAMQARAQALRAAEALQQAAEVARKARRRHRRPGTSGGRGSGMSLLLRGHARSICRRRGSMTPIYATRRTNGRATR
jgi:hypothetical protein